MGFMHGTNDAQKTMGIIALTLARRNHGRCTSTNCPAGLSFLRTAAPLPGKDWKSRCGSKSSAR